MSKGMTFTDGVLQRIALTFMGVHIITAECSVCHIISALSLCVPHTYSRLIQLVISSKPNHVLASLC